MINHIFPFEKIEKGSSILLWGAGRVGREYYVQVIQTGFCQVVGIIDQAVKCEEGIFCTKKSLDLEYDYVVIAVEKEEIQKEIEEELLLYGVVPDKIIKSNSVVNWFCEASVEQLKSEDSVWECIYRDYAQYAIGDFAYFDPFILDLKSCKCKEEIKQSFLDNINKISWDAKTVLLRVLLVAECFDGGLMELYLESIRHLKNPELAVCLLYEIVWKEVVHSEYRYPGYYNDRRNVITENTKKLLKGEDITFEKKVLKQNNVFHKICILRLNFPAYEKSNATRRNLQLANEFAKRGYDVEMIVLDYMEHPHVVSLMNFTGYYEVPVPNTDYIGEGLRIYYATGYGIREKAVDVLREVKDFDPDLIIDSCADYEILTNILYQYYPVIQIPCRNSSSCTYMHRCILPSEEVFNKEWNIFHSLDKKKARFLTRYLKLPVDLGQIIPGIERKKHNISDDAFVIATMSARVGAEASNEFVDAVSSVLYKYNNIVWILAGNGTFEYIKGTYSELVEEGRIILWGYEKDADSFWKRLDVKLSVFPKVTGNGGGACKALYSGVPVLINTSNGDIASILGYGRMVEGGYQELAARIEELYLDCQKLEEASRDAKQIAESLPTAEEYVNMILKWAKEVVEEGFC